MVKFIKAHPFATVMFVAVVLRLLAVFYSKGYMASDDHFQTEHVSYDWVLHGLDGPDGHLRWKDAPASTISRFPLYTLLLYVNMEVARWFGADTLDQIMYFVRARLALVSLLAVAAVYGIVLIGSGSRIWAMIAGLIMAAQFAMPFLSVRTLIETVGGAVWVFALYLYYRYDKLHRERWLVLFGVVSGLAFMFRFELLFAFWIVPFLIWYQYRKFRPAVIYAATLLTMLLVAGLADWYLLGTFMGSSINHIKQGLTEGPVYRTSYLMYIEVLLAFFIPPISILLFVVACRKRFWSKHLVLVGSCLTFLLFHTLISSRQERYILPIIPALVALFVLALHQHFASNGYLARSRKLFGWLVGFSVVVNTILLIPLTFNYAHKGLVEPLVKIEKLNTERRAVLFVTPERYINFPYLYGGLGKNQRDYVYGWSDLTTILPHDTKPRFDFAYFLLYPKDSADLPVYVDSLSNHVGPIRELFHVGPSTADWMLHRLNPRFNPTNDVWVFVRAD